MELTAIAQWLNTAFAGYDYAILQALHNLAEAAGGFFTPLCRAITLLGEKGILFLVLGIVLMLLPIALIFSDNSMANLQTVSIIASWLSDTKSGKTCSNTHRKTGRISDVYTVLTPNSRPIKRNPTTRSAAFKIKVSTEIGSGTTFPKSIARPEILPTDTPLGIRKK